MSSVRAVDYWLYPSVRQTNGLARLLESQRQLYNAALEERRGSCNWAHRGASSFAFTKKLRPKPQDGKVTFLSQNKALTAFRGDDPALWEFGRTVQNSTLYRLDLAFRSLYRGGGFPRFRGKGRWDSVSYQNTQSWKLYETGEKKTYGRLYLQGVGHIKVRLKHGPRSARLRGGVPVCLTVRMVAGRWKATVMYKNVEPNEYPEPRAAAVGIDRGVAVLAATVDSNGDTGLEPNPRHLRKMAEKLAEQQRKLAGFPRGQRKRKRREQVLRVARLHTKIRNARKDRNHQLSRKLVNSYRTLVFEDLKIQNMTRSAKGTLENPGSQVSQKAGLNKSILDAGWGELARMVSYKAEEAGRKVVFADPRFTSQICSKCGFKSRENRDQRDFRCRKCGFAWHADLNGAANILARGWPRSERTSRD